MLQADSSVSTQFTSLFSSIDPLAAIITDPRTGTLFLLLLIAAVIDYRIYKIPNWLTFGGTFFALAISTVFPFTPSHGFLWALGGCAMGLVSMLPFYLLRVMGAGDVKLMAMVGAFLGVSEIVYAVVYTFIVGGAAALLFALHHRVFGRMIDNIKAATQTILLSAATGAGMAKSMQITQSVGKLPYGVSIAIGTMGYVVANHTGFM